MKSFWIGLMMLLIAGFFLISSTIAEPDSVKTGPYLISFDLGLPHDAYSVTVNPPKEERDPLMGQTIIYQIGIGYNSENLMKAVESGNFLNSAIIEISSFTFEPTYVSGDAYIKVIQDELEQFEFNVNIKTDKITIDRQKGAIISYGTKLTQDYTQDHYDAAYVPSADSHALVSVDSTYPWDEGTRQLLDTIHIEKVNSAA